MKKLFSFLIICFVLSFSSCFAAFQTALDSINQCASASTDIIDSDYSYYFNYAYNYFYNNYSAVFDNYNYVYMYPVSAEDDDDPDGASIRFVLWASNSEPALSSGDLATNKVFGTFRLSSASSIYGVALDMNYTTFGSIDSTNVYTNTVNNTTLGSINSKSTNYNWCHYGNLSHVYSNFVGNSLSLNGLGAYVRSKTGTIKYYLDSNYQTTDTLLNVQGFVAPITSIDFYDVSISRNNLDLISNGMQNFYTYTNISFKFSDFFINNNISSNADLYYTLIINDLNYAIIPITKAVNGFTQNTITFNINDKPNILGSLSNGLTFVCWYVEQGSTPDVRLGQTAYNFNVFANSTSTGTSPTGSDNTTTVSGYNNNMPINIYNNIREQDGLDAAGINTNVNLDFYDIDDNGMRSRFSNMFDFFSVAFSWLPSEIIAMVKVGFAVAVTFIIYKIIRG